MAALTKNTNRDTRPGVGTVKPYVVASGSTIYQGSFVGLNASGYLVPWTVSTGAALFFVGIANEKVVGDNALTCRCDASGVELRAVAVTGASTIGDVRKPVYLTDDGTGITISAPAAGGKVGHITKFISSTQFDVRLYTREEYLAAAQV